MDERRKDIRKRFTKNKGRLYKYDQNFYTKIRKIIHIESPALRVDQMNGGYLHLDCRIFQYGQLKLISQNNIFYIPVCKIK